MSRISHTMPRTRNSLSWLIGVLTIFAIIYFVEARELIIVQIVDFWLHLDKARTLSLSNITTFVDPLYPVGYFALLRLGLELNIDVARLGQIISLIGAVATIVGVYMIVYHGSSSPKIAFASCFILIVHPFFRLHAMRQGTDMLAAGLQLLALSLLFWSPQKHIHRYIFIAGIMLGLSYLTRYTGLILVPIAILSLWVRTKRQNKEALIFTGIFLIAFLITTLPQTIPSLVVYKTPFYNEQARNVWFGVYGEFNWSENWSKIPPKITLQQIVQNDPQTFFLHWFSEFGRFFRYGSGDGLIHQPLALERYVTLWNPLINHLLWIVGCIILLFDRRLLSYQKMLLLLSLFIPVLITSMAWLFNRFLLLALSIQAIVIALALIKIAEKLTVVTSRQIIITYILIIGQIGLMLTSTFWDQKNIRVRDMNQLNKDVGGILMVAGMETPYTVLTNNRLLQITNLPAHPRYEIAAYHGNDPSLDTDEFINRIISNRTIEYLFFDWSSHAIRTYDFAPYRTKLVNANHHLTPLLLSKAYSLYCQLPCDEGMIKLNEQAFPENIQLIGYRAYWSMEHELPGIYLYWHSETTITQSYTVTLTLFDNQDQRLFQLSSIPAGGAFPTNEWTPNSQVVDFRLGPSIHLQPDQTYQLIVALTASDLPDAGDVWATTIPVQFSAR